MKKVFLIMICFFAINIFNNKECFAEKIKLNNAIYQMNFTTPTNDKYYCAQICSCIYNKKINEIKCMNHNKDLIAQEEGCFLSCIKRSDNSL